ncbi:MAG: molybdopterin-dependent oxidoreductase [Bacillota bacterium]|nr:molybdopterin-dependent oxidoreductase [Bacillota bacterium]
MCRINRLIRSAVMLAVIAVVTVVACGCGVDDIDISGYSDEQIVITGIDGTDDSEEIVNISQLKALDCTTVKTHSTSDKIGEVRATGPTLDTLLQQYGASQRDFSRIEIYGRDGYDIALSQKVIEENEIILAFGIDGEPLDDDSVPCRIIIPESDSAYWIRMVDRIKLIK